VSALRSMMGLESDTPPETWSFYGLAAEMWNHMPVMASSMDELGIERPHLQPGEIADLVVFVFNHADPTAPGDTAVGRALFIQKSCIRCHQVGGIGGVTGPSLDLTSQFHSPIRLAASMWNHGPGMAESLSAKGIRRSSLTGSESHRLRTRRSVCLFFIRCGCAPIDSGSRSPGKRRPGRSPVSCQGVPYLSR
jgi:mono/diheme cytochrome c family protein